jgi:hypothetical protein
MTGEPMGGGKTLIGDEGKTLEISYSLAYKEAVRLKA